MLLPTVSDIRARLNWLTSDLIPDDVIQANIDDVSTYVDAVKSTDADSQLVELCKIMGACYHVLLSYACAAERAGREILTSVLQQMTEFKERYTSLLEMIQRSASAPEVFACETTESVLDEVLY